MNIDFKSPYVIGGGVLLGALLLLSGRSKAGGLTAADISAGSLASSVQQNIALGVPSIQAETDRQKTQAELAALTVTSRAALATQQQANQYAFAAAALESASTVKQLNQLAQIKQADMLGNAVVDVVSAGAATSNDVVRNYQANQAKSQLMSQAISGELALEGMATRLAKTLSLHQKEIAEKQIQAQVDIAKKKADSDLFGSIFGSITKIFG